MCSARSVGVVDVAAGHALERRQAAVDHQHLRRLVLRPARSPRRAAACRAPTLPLRLPASALTMTFGCGIVDAAGQADRWRSRRRPPNGSRRCARRPASRTRPRGSSACRSARGRPARRRARCRHRRPCAAPRRAAGGSCRSSPRRSRSRRRSAPAGRRASARWRSTALWHRLVVPPTNQLRERRPAVVADLRRTGLLPVDQLRPARPRSRPGSLIDLAWNSLYFAMYASLRWCGL